MLKKALSLILSLMLVCSAASVSVLAAESQILSGLEAESLLYAPLIEEGGESWLVDSLSLPSTYQDSKITWTSSNRAVISEKGSVSRPAVTDAEVILTATTADGSKDFTFKVPAITTKVGTTPAITGTLIDDDFEDGTKSSRFAYNSPNFEADGGLNLWYNTNANIYPYEDLSKKLTGSFYTEMVITKPKDHTGRIELYGPGDATIFALDYKNYNENMQLFSYRGYVNESTTDWIYPTTPNASEFEKIKIGMYFNSTDQTVSIWVNNREFLMNEKTRNAVDGNTAAIAGLDRITLRSDSSINSIKLEDFKLYAVEEVAGSDAEIASSDAEALTKGCLNFGGYLADNIISQNIKLPITGICGSEITWSSSNTAVCDDSGKITRPAGSISTPVTLTATVKSGSESVTKTFDFSVAGADLDYVAMPSLLAGDESNYLTNLTFDTLAANVKNTKGNQNDLTVADGKLTFKGASNYNNTTPMGIRITSDSGAEFTGVMALEATIKKSAANPVDIGIESTGGYNVFRTEWLANNNFSSQYRVSNAEGVGTTWNTAPIGAVTSEAKLVVFADSRTDRIAAWINGVKVAEGYAGTTMLTGKKFRNFYVTCADTSTTVTIDDVKMYYATPDTAYRFTADTANLDEWTLPAIIEDNIGATAKYGSYVNWTSDDESIINSKGVVTRPNDDLTHTVNLTANIMGVNAGETTQKSFTATVAGKDYNAFPTLYGNDAANMKADYNFDDDVVPTNINNVKGYKNNLTCANGVLSFVGASNYNGSTPMGIRVRAADNKEFRGVAAFEADITRSNTGKVILQLEGTGGANLYGIEWPSSGTIQSRHADSADATSGWKSLSVTKAKTFNIKIFVDPRTDRLTVWFDGEKAVDAYLNTDMSTVAARNFRDILIGCESTSTTIKVDNIKMYYALPATEHRLECDRVDFANYALPESVTEDMELPSKLPYGSYLTWTSNNEAITADGKVTRGEEDVVVNLTATPSAAGVTGEAKTFAVTVKAFQDPVYKVAASDGSCKANYYVVQDASGYPTAKCYLVLYDGSKLVSVKTAEIADAANDGTAPAAELEFTSDEITAFGAAAPSAKAFIWKSGSIVPLSASVPVSAAN